MANTNSENPTVGREFQNRVCSIMAKYYNQKFNSEVKVPIGNPLKDHRFDCVSEDKSIVVECKCYTWTDTGNVPSAKMATLNEAVFYMSFLPKETIKIIALKKATFPTKIETLAEYYFRINGHLLGDIKVFEIDDKDNVQVIQAASNMQIVERKMAKNCSTINNLWWNGGQGDWDNALKYYWSLLRPENISTEMEFENFDIEAIKKINTEEFYTFLHDKYFVWKFTAKNRLATTRKCLERYKKDNCMNELAQIHSQLMSFNLNDINSGIKIAKSIHGLGTAGASGLLAILFPQYFGTVDQFVVKSLCSIEDLPEQPRLLKIKADSLNEKDGQILINILRQKSAELNNRFNTDKWTPRNIDKVLWSIGR